MPFVGKIKRICGHTIGLSHLGLVTPCPKIGLHGQQLELCSLPLSAAQLDSIGFSIIRKCIHAVETRGK